MRKYQEIENLKPESLPGIYSDIAEVAGVEAAYKIYERYRGLQISFPSRFLENDYVVECIKNEYDGTNVKQLAKKYEYSESRVRQLLKGSKDKR